MKDKEINLAEVSLDAFDENGQEMSSGKNAEYEDSSSIEKIYIPVACRELPIHHFDLSVRLENVLRRLHVESLGDLHQKSFTEIEQTRNCGRKTIDELHQLVTKLQDENFTRKIDDKYQNYLENIQRADARNDLVEQIEKTSEHSPDKLRTAVNGKIFVPQSVGEIPVNCFTLSIRLKNILNNLNVELLGDLEAFSISEIKQTKNCGGKTRDELQSLIARIQRIAADEESSEAVTKTLPSELNLKELLNFINKFLAELPAREREVLLDRLGGRTDEKVLTLEEIGEKFKVTRERIRQIESKHLKDLKSRVTGICETALEKLSDDCSASVCPLTARFLVHLAENEFTLFERPSNFYLRLLNELSPGVPVFIKNQTYVNQMPERAAQAARRIRSLLDEQSQSLTLAEVFNRLSNRNAIDDLTMKDFFAAIQARDFIIQPGDSPDILLIDTDKNRLTMTQMARQVLHQSERSLTPEEIIKRAKELFGTEIELTSANSLSNIVRDDPNFYLLDKRTIGLRRHFRLPEEKWAVVKNDFYKLLAEKKRPLSTTEVVNGNLFEWARETTAGESSEILREDERFTDLGRFLFALAEWQIEEREPVKDLAVKVLEQAGHPLTASEIGEQIQKYRSVSITSMRTILCGHEAVREFNFGHFNYFGLKQWKIDFREFFITKKNLIYHFIKRSKTITFGALCQEFGIDFRSETAEKLWRTLRNMSDLKFVPVYKSPETKITRVYW